MRVAARSLCTGWVLRASCGLQGVRMVFYNSDANLLLLELPSIPPSYRPYYLGNHPGVWHREHVCFSCTPHLSVFTQSMEAVFPCTAFTLQL
jgi:hypothetical protein